MKTQTKYISLLLHFYQPCWQEPGILKQIVAECYEPLLGMFMTHEQYPLSININYSLLELLRRHRHERTLDLISKFLGRNGRELTGTAAYHPIMPLIPRSEMRRQIALNETGVKDILGISPGPGFFLPEMAFDKNVLPALRDDYRWTLVDDGVFSHPRFAGFAPCKSVPCQDGFLVMMRSSHWSNRLSFNHTRETPETYVHSMRISLDNWFSRENEIRQTCGQHNPDAGYLILAMDAETFGHHVKNYQYHLLGILEAIRRIPDMELVSLSALTDLFPKVCSDIGPTSWSTESHHIESQAWFPLWNHPDNRCHHLLWSIIERVLDDIDGNDSDTRALADKVINSCQFWWLSPEHWNPDNAFKTMPLILEFFRQRNGHIPASVRSTITELENLTGRKIL